MAGVVFSIWGMFARNFDALPAHDEDNELTIASLTTRIIMSKYNCKREKIPCPSCNTSLETGSLGMGTYRYFGLERLEIVNETIFDIVHSRCGLCLCGV